MLTIFNATHFRGLLVMTSKGPLVEQYLERTFDTLHRALASHRKVFAIRVDLRFPLCYWPLDGQILGNDYITRFIASLEAKIQHHQKLSIKQGRRVHAASLRFIWAREYRRGEDKPHFHLLILLNGDAYRALGSFGPGSQSLASQITEAWASALGLACIDSHGLVHFPANAQYHVDARDTASVEALFYRTSYLCKVRSKVFDEHVHPFGCSRS